VVRACDTRKSAWSTLKRDLEALLFASGEPLPVAVMARVLTQPEGPSELEIEAALAEMQAEYSSGAQRALN